MNDLISRQAAIDELDKFIQWCDKALRSPHIESVDAFAVKIERTSLKRYREVLELLEPAQPERKNESVGCNGCRYDWFGDPRCNRCARSFQDFYETDMRGEQDALN